MRSRLSAGGEREGDDGTGVDCFKGWCVVSTTVFRRRSSGVESTERLGSCDDAIDDDVVGVVVCEGDSLRIVFRLSNLQLMFSNRWPFSNDWEHL